MCTLRVIVHGENRHETKDETGQKIYPDGMHTVLAEGVRTTLKRLGQETEIRFALLDDIDDDLPENVLEKTDVLPRWGHMAHMLDGSASLPRMNWCSSPPAQAGRAAGQHAASVATKSISSTSRRTTENTRRTTRRKFKE